MFKKRRLIFAAIISVSAAALYASSTNSLLPTGNGFYAQWTPSTGASHSALVDDTPCNGATDYNFTTTVGNRDSYSVSLSSVPDGSKITQIDIKPCASRNTAGGANPVMKVFYRLNGANSSDSGSYSLSGVTPAELATTSYSSLSIIKSATSTLEVGSVLNSGTKGVRLSRISSILTYTTLSAPSSLSAGTTTSSQISLSWLDNSSFEDGFYLERKNDTASTSFATIATTSANATSYNDSGLTASTTYSYRIRAFNFGGTTSYSNTVTKTTLDTLPDAPSGLTTTATSSSSVSLGWVDNSLNETNFVVERKNDTASSSYAVIATTTSNKVSYFDNSVSSSTSYTYRLRAYNSAGYSAYTSESSVTTPPKAPVSPSSLTSTPTSPNNIDLSWSDRSSIEDGYLIERKDNTNSIPYLNIATTSANATSYSDSLLSTSTNYSYRVRAFNTGGYSTYSSVATASTTNGTPTSPSGLFTIATSSVQIDLSWLDNSSDEDSFVIERKNVTASTTFSTIATTTANTVLYNDSGLTASTTYSYRLRSYNVYGYSAYSGTSNATTNP